MKKSLSLLCLIFILMFSACNTIRIGHRQNRQNSQWQNFSLTGKKYTLQGRTAGTPTSNGIIQVPITIRFSSDRDANMRNGDMMIVYNYVIDRENGKVKLYNSNTNEQVREFTIVDENTMTTPSQNNVVETWKS